MGRKATGLTILGAKTPKEKVAELPKLKHFLIVPAFSAGFFILPPIFPEVCLKNGRAYAQE